MLTIPSHTGFVPSPVVLEGERLDAVRVHDARWRSVHSVPDESRRVNRESRVLCEIRTDEHVDLDDGLREQLPRVSCRRLPRLGAEDDLSERRVGVRDVCTGVLYNPGARRTPRLLRESDVPLKARDRLCPGGFKQHPVIQIVDKRAGVGKDNFLPLIRRPRRESGSDPRADQSGPLQPIISRADESRIDADVPGNKHPAVTFHGRVSFLFDLLRHFEFKAVLVALRVFFVRDKGHNAARQSILVLLTLRQSDVFHIGEYPSSDLRLYLPVGGSSSDSTGNAPPIDPRFVKASGVALLHASSYVAGSPVAKWHYRLPQEGVSGALHRR